MSMRPLPLFVVYTVTSDGGITMSQEADKDEKLDLTTKLLDGKGTLEEAEQWIARLKDIDPYFESSDLMLSLERGVKASRKALELAAEIGQKLNREQLIGLVEKLLSGEGTEEEVEAWLILLEQNVLDPQIGDYIYWPQYHGLDDDRTAAQIVDKALSYKPILLGPATNSSS
jgi:hypothetical protein